MENTENGEVSGETLFHYRWRGDVIWATYEGGSVRLGTAGGKSGKDGQLHFLYQRVNVQGEFMRGRCRSIPKVLEDGRYRLNESWQRTSGDRSSGCSIVEEIRR